MIIPIVRNEPLEIAAPIPLYAFREERIEHGLEGWIGNFAHPIEEGWG
jgi:hypothetical protein